MNVCPEKIWIYHITDVANLPAILAGGGLCADTLMAEKNSTVIGYEHIKERRLNQIRVPCCDGRFVGEFVPFYFCPRSPMLYTINKGRTGRLPGCQQTILHLVSTLAIGIGLKRAWAISDGNAGAFHTSFYTTLDAIKALDWPAIRATDWKGKQHQKSAEFLVSDFFPWEGFHTIGCQNSAIAGHVKTLLQPQTHHPLVEVKPLWYY
jgi:hypothetical protein